ARLAGQLDFKLSEPPELEVVGRLTATPGGRGSSAPLAARFAARYRPRAQRVDLSRLDLEWGPALRVDLTGNAEELDTAPRLAFKVAGTVDGSRLTGHATYSGASGGLTAKLDLQPFAAGLLLERFGYARPAFEVNARSAGLRLEGRVEGKDGVRVEGALGLEGVEAPPWVMGTPLRANLRIAGTLSRLGGRISLGGLDRGELALASSTADIGLVTALTQPRPARDAGAWPLHMEARIPDLSRLPPIEGLPFALSGEARVRGSFDWTDSSPRFAGHLTAHVTRGEVNVGGPLVISDLRASLPLAFGRGEEASAGSVAAESLSAFGFVLRRPGSPARMRGSVLSLPEITYAHYGGSGRGYARLDLSGAAVPLSMRLEGEGVNLATLTTEYGLTVGRITGKVSYLLVLQHSRAGGLVVGGHVVSDPPGGEVNIEALNKLLSYAEADPTGILKRTLESLSVFSYESLTGDIRVGPQGGRVSLFLEGKKRLGLFPGRVQGINFRNIPLSLLVKTFGQPRRDSP
ncbi:MAG: hypothetical protein HY725_01395, partial [Candidatus Rokubacteria bacterium]|nr:hypothetical protein [Candidatus Rokubacteria bacterium]